MSLLFAAASCFAERIKVNSITRETRAGRRLYIKRRRRAAALVLAGANRFFRATGNPIRALVDLRAWQQWEIECFRQLHGTAFQVSVSGPRAVATEHLPGVPLAQALDRHALTPEMCAAAGRELRRCHETSCAIFPDHWTHGDPHAGNFLFDPADGRARLIDFEVLHDPVLSAAERRADDLLVFLQDVIGRVARAEWLPLAAAFVEGYDHPATTARLVPRLVLPRGLARLWWAVRTTYLPSAELTCRLEILREALSRPAVPA